MSTINFFGKQRDLYYVDPSSNTPGDGSTPSSPLTTFSSGGYSNAVMLMRRTSTPLQIDNDIAFGNDVFLLGLPRVLVGISGFGMETPFSTAIDPSIFQTWNDEYQYATIKLTNNAGITIRNTPDSSSSVAFGMNRILLTTDTAVTSGASVITYSSDNGSGFISNCCFIDNIDNIDISQTDEIVTTSGSGSGLRFYFDNLNDFYFINNNFSVVSETSLSDGYIHVENSDSFHFNNNSVWLASNNDNTNFSRFIYSSALTENINITNNEFYSKKFLDRPYLGHVMDIYSPSSIIKNNTITLVGVGDDAVLDRLIYVYNNANSPGYFIFRDNTISDTIAGTKTINNNVVHLQNVSKVHQGESIVRNNTVTFPFSDSLGVNNPSLLYINLPGQNCDNLIVESGSETLGGINVQNASYMRGLDIKGKTVVQNVSFAEFEQFEFTQSFTPYVFSVDESFIRIKKVILKLAWDSYNVAWLSSTGRNTRVVIDQMNETVKIKTNENDNPYGIWVANYDGVDGTWYGDNISYYAQSWEVTHDGNNTIRFKSRSEGSPLWVAPPTLGGIKKTPSSGLQKIRVYVAFKNFSFMESYVSKFIIYVETGNGATFNSVSHGVWSEYTLTNWSDVSLTKRYCDVYFETSSLDDLNIRFSYDWADNSGVFYLDPVVEILSV